MNGPDLAALLDRALERLNESRDELRDLDAAVGDGDLGITVSKGCEATRAKLAQLTDPRPADVLRATGTSVLNANPSTMAALAGGGLLAAAKAIGEADDIGRAEAVIVLSAAATNIALRGKASVGDKTMLDAIVPSLATLEASPESSTSAETLAAMVTATRRAVQETSSLQSRRGRASWLGERSVGHPDPGATAFLRLLEALEAAWRPGSTGDQNPITDVGNQS
jgi:dihydroxyacetone kinase-like protein